MLGCSTYNKRLKQYDPDCDRNRLPDQSTRNNWPYLNQIEIGNKMNKGVGGGIPVSEYKRKIGNFVNVGFSNPAIVARMNQWHKSRIDRDS